MIDGDVEVSLTKLEFKLLDVLSQKPKMTFSYDEIEKQVYGSDSKTRQYRITNLIYHLRRKLERTTGQNKVYIKTVRSRGYMLDIYNNNVR
nr:MULTISPECIES: helix-turn-helix domain-containing protein [Enterococcus]